MYVYIWRSYLKELVIVETWQDQYLQDRVACWRLREELKFKVKVDLLEGFPLPSGRSVFFYRRSSVDWMRPSHIPKENVFYSKTADLNANLI